MAEIGPLRRTSLENIPDWAMGFIEKAEEAHNRKVAQVWLSQDTELCLFAFAKKKRPQILFHVRIDDDLDDFVPRPRGTNNVDEDEEYEDEYENMDEDTQYERRGPRPENPNWPNRTET